jgi:hypothetical protein
MPPPLPGYRLFSTWKAGPGGSATGDFVFPSGGTNFFSISSYTADPVGNDGIPTEPSRHVVMHTRNSIEVLHGVAVNLSLTTVSGTEWDKPGYVPRTPKVAVILVPLLFSMDDMVDAVTGGQVDDLVAAGVELTFVQTAGGLNQAQYLLQSVPVSAFAANLRLPGESKYTLDVTPIDPTLYQGGEFYVGTFQRNPSGFIGGFGGFYDFGDRVEYFNAHVVRDIVTTGSSFPPAPPPISGMTLIESKTTTVSTGGLDERIILELYSEATGLADDIAVLEAHAARFERYGFAVFSANLPDSTPSQLDPGTVLSLDSTDVVTWKTITGTITGVDYRVPALTYDGVTADYPTIVGQIVDDVLDFFS